MKRENNIYKKYLKRSFDFTLSLLAIVILFPLLLILSILGTVFMHGNPFFVQLRPGRNEKIFKLIKFRTMDNRKDKDGHFLPDKIRINKYGKILRSTSLDELPELINILKGDMSIVGPRPLLKEYLPYYNSVEKHRHDIRPGLTGLAQVNGRSFISWERIFEYDIEYLNNITLKNDMCIIINTIKKVLCRDDIADASKMFVGKDGKTHIIVDNVEYTVHQSLVEERS